MNDVSADMFTLSKEQEAPSHINVEVRRTQIGKQAEVATVPKTQEHKSRLIAHSKENSTSPRE